MKILLTGSSGHIGSVVARELLSAGHEVRALDISAPPGELRSAQLEVVYANITDRLSLLKAAQGCEAIVHLAAIPNPMQGTDKLAEINICGTQYILEAAEANAIERVVLASSASIYGLPFARHPFDPDYLPMDEEHLALRRGRQQRGWPYCECGCCRDAALQQFTTTKFIVCHFAWFPYPNTLVS